MEDQLLELTFEEFIERLNNGLFNEYHKTDLYKAYSKSYSLKGIKPELYMQDLPSKTFIRVANNKWVVNVVTYESERWGDAYLIGEHKNFLRAVQIAWLSFNIKKQVKLVKKKSRKES